jgi:hypothetical protein
VLRLAGVPDDRLPQRGQVWAASPTAVDALVAAGLPRERVAWVPPMVRPFACGPGGDGTVVLLGAHAPSPAARALAELARIAPGRVRVLPVAASPEVERLVHGALPDAEILPPCSSERRFAALAATADVVVCADPSDRFQRRALVAAAAGAAPVVLGPGAATAVLGRTPGLEDALGDGDRARRAAAVRAACDGAAAVSLVAHAEVA